MPNDRVGAGEPGRRPGDKESRPAVSRDRRLVARTTAGEGSILAEVIKAMPAAAETLARLIGRGRMQPYLDPIVEFFDRTSVPPQIQELLDEWPEIDPGTARLIRAAVMSREPRRLRQAWEMLNTRAELARGMRLNGSPHR